MSKNKIKERVNPFKGGIGSFNMPMSADKPGVVGMSGYNGTPGSADTTFSRKSSVPLNATFEEDENTEDLLLDDPDEAIEEDEISEFSGTGAVAGYTGRLQAPSNPEEFYNQMNIYNEEVVKLTRESLRKIILEEIKNILN